MTVILKNFTDVALDVSRHQDNAVGEVARLLIQWPEPLRVLAYTEAVARVSARGQIGIDADNLIRALEMALGAYQVTREFGDGR